MPTANYPNEVIEMNENDPTREHFDGFSTNEEVLAKSGGGQSEAIEDATTEDIQADLKSIEEMRTQAETTKKKGLRHQPSMYAAKKRKHKLALQRAARKRQRRK